jgi:ABC-type sugar transport system ATPase subunit
LIVSKKARPSYESALLGEKNIGTFSLDAEFEAADGEFLSLLGPSGCGKTTLLRLIAGLIKPDKGSILIDGRDVSAEPAYKRGIGLFFRTTHSFPTAT